MPPKGKQEDGGRNDKVNMSRVTQAPSLVPLLVPRFVLDSPPSIIPQV